MIKIAPLFTVLLFVCLFIRQSFAVSETFNVEVGYGGANELVIRTDSPGAFNYKLYLRTSDNTPTLVSVRYTGVTNLYRAIRLSCGPDELKASDHPDGTCLTGGPFVRGAFVAGNNDQFAEVKRFTLFCGSLQVVGEERTNQWNSDFDNSAIKNFLDNGASSTWCPPPALTSTPKVTPIKKSTPTPTKKPRPSRSPSPTVTVLNESIETKTPTPTRPAIGSMTETVKPGNNFPLWMVFGSAIPLGILTALGFWKKTMIVSFLHSLKKSNPSPPSDTESEIFE